MRAASDEQQVQQQHQRQRNESNIVVFKAHGGSQARPKCNRICGSNLTSTATTATATTAATTTAQSILAHFLFIFRASHNLFRFSLEGSL